MTTRNQLRIAFVVFLFGCAAIPPVLFLLEANELGSAHEVTAAVWSFLVRAFWIALAVGVVALLAYPPSIPWLKVAWRGIRARMTIDRSSMAQALSRLEHHETADDHFVVANVAWQMRDMDRVIHHVDRALRCDPKALKARHLGGRALLSISQFEAAAKNLAQVVEQEENFNYGGALLGLARAMFHLRRFDEAADLLDRHEELNGGNREALLLRARVEGRRGDAAKRKEYLRRAAAEPAEGEIMAPEAQLARARARVALWGRGSAA